MAALLLRDLSPALHERLKTLARRNRRSMAREAETLLAAAIEAACAEEHESAAPRRTGTVPAHLAEAILDGRYVSVATQDALVRWTEELRAEKKGTLA